MIQVITESKVAIIGGGKVCKEILKIVLGSVFGNVKPNILGVCDIDNKAKGFLYAKKKGIYTTNDYRKILKLKELNTIVELTGNDRFLQNLRKKKPRGVRLIDHFEAMSLWDFLQIEVKKKNMEEQLCENVIGTYNLGDKVCEEINRSFKQFSEELSDIVKIGRAHV